MRKIILPTTYNNDKMNTSKINEITFNLSCIFKLNEVKVRLLKILKALLSNSE